MVKGEPKRNSRVGKQVQLGCHALHTAIGVEEDKSEQLFVGGF